MDIQEIEKLIKLLKKTGIAEIEVKEGDKSLRLTQHAPASETHHIKHVSSAPMHQAPAPHVHLAPTPPPVAEKSKHTGHHVRSPMVGTLYTSSSPEASPFVSIGQNVRVGETLCIIEAMKMFNEIESDKAGVITAILVSNGDPIEYDQPLFVIE